MRVCVFCSAGSKCDPEFIAIAKEFSKGLAKRNWELVYGGSQLGLMGAFANSMLENGGKVHGYIPKFFTQNKYIQKELGQQNPQAKSLHPSHQAVVSAQEIMHTKLTTTFVTEDMMDRKTGMINGSDVFLIFPGGYGTLDEALEVLTWRVLDLHQKPIVFVNLKGFWQTQLQVFAELSNAGMIQPDALKVYNVCDSVDQTWSFLDEYWKKSRT